MKNTRLHPPSPAAGFTLIEMIGVLAIMGILAGVLVPNALRAIENAAVAAEVKTLHGLGDQVRTYLRTQGTPPPVATWLRSGNGGTSPAARRAWSRALRSTTA